MATETETKLVWVPIDFNNSSDEAVDAFTAAKEAYQVYAKLKGVAEQLAIDEAGLPATHTLRFAYRHGPPVAAVVLADGPKKARKGSMTLADIGKAFVSETRLIKRVA
jgi:hypothetical protein